MLSGVKFIPRDQLNSGRENHDSDSSLGDENETGSKKGRHEKRSKRSKSHVNDSNHRGSRDRVEYSSRKGKKKWDASGDESCSSSSYDERGSSSDMEVLKRRKSKEARRREKEGSSSDKDEDVYHKRKGRHGKEKSKTREVDGGDLNSKRAGMLARKEMGLDWMTMPQNHQEVQLAPVCDVVLHSQPEVVEKKSNSKELNPYFRDSGSGYPDEVSQGETNNHQLAPSSLVGDGGASWRLKALKRAKEQAFREGRKVNEVVEERWGSLGNLALSVASQRAAPAKAHLHAISDRKKGQVKTHETIIADQLKGGRDNEELHSVREGYLKDVSSRHPEMRRPKHESFPWRKGKDHNSMENISLVSEAISSINKYANDGSFMHEITLHQKDVSDNPHTNVGDHEYQKAESSENTISKKECSASSQGFSSNKSAAKVLQLRLKGKHEEAEKLLKDMQAIKQDSGADMCLLEGKGNARRHASREMSSQMKKREDDCDLNLAQKIMRNKKYNISSRADDEYEIDDDAPVKKRNLKNGGVSEGKGRASNRLLTQLERCQFCFDNSAGPKHLVISIAQFTYLMLPQWQSVVQGHCCILPMQHEPATRSVDDNVWEEIRNFKKCLVMMFAKEEKGLIFLETVMGLAKQRRHCLVECIPLPRDLANEAPLYFKKAIDEAEDEWSQHNAKKLIHTTREKGLRRSVPKDFPYFHVEFGLDVGFVHVIDDEGKFKSSMGLNVIRGMLKLPEEDMHRRRRQESTEKQRHDVAAFARDWEPFDWTKQLS